MIEIVKSESNVSTEDTMKYVVLDIVKAIHTLKKVPVMDRFNYDIDNAIDNIEVALSFVLGLNTEEEITTFLDLINSDMTEAEKADNLIETFGGSES